MNITRLNALADHLERLADPATETDLGFSMSNFVTTPEEQSWFRTMDVHSHGWHDSSGHECRTTACIAGHAVALDGLSAAELLRADEVLSETLPDRAMVLLGLTERQAEHLFYGSLDVRITPRQAASVVRHLVATGEVDWSPVERQLERAQ